MNLVYADSLTAVSIGEFRYLGDKTRPDSSESFRRSIAIVESLPCDIMLSTHPGTSGLFERLARRSDGQAVDPLIDTNACRAYAANARKNLEQRLKTEREAATK